MCTGDYTNSDEKGGLLFVSKAVCPKCAPGLEKDANTYGETHFIRARALDGESFREFVLRLRAGRNRMRVDFY
jgi:hypothetical protein